MVCSDPAEHRRRAEGRTVDIDGLRLPTWDDILARDYRPWDREHLVVDTAATSLPDAVARIVRAGWGERRAPTTEAPPPAERDEP